ncbi:MAG: MarR family winged helix-turn-helix transcriptional regulator [Candidatus Bathyarchaeota archaeon]
MAHEAIQKARSILVKKENVEKVKSLFARKAKTEEGPAEETIPQQEPVQAIQKYAVPQKSKLVMCIEILCTLVSRGPMKLTQLLDHFTIDQTRLTAHLRLLWDRGLIEEETFDDNQTYYLVTPRGKTVLKVVGPILKEAHKIQMREFDYLSNTLEGAGYK